MPHNLNILKKQNKNKLIGIFCLIMVIVGLGYFAFLKYQQSKIHTQGPEGFSVKTQTDNLMQVGRQWLEDYTKQYQQKYIQRNKKLISYSVNSIAVLDNEVNQVIQLDFMVTPEVVNSSTSSLWKGVANGSQIRCQWVLWFTMKKTSDGSIVYSAIKQQTPAGYDLEKYNSSQQKSKDEYNQQFVKEKPYKQAQYTYKIDKQKCSVTYDGGTTWREVPLDLKSLVAVGDGNTHYNELQEGSYIIAPEKTAFLYGGTKSEGLMIIYSEDEGRTWRTAQINREINSVRVKFVSFTSLEVGYAIASEGRTMSQESQAIFKTTDGGVTWKTVGFGPRTNLINNGGFIDDSVGFVSYPDIEGAETNFYRTEDGGKTFKPITLPVVKEEWMGFTLEPFVEPKTPYLEDGKLYLLVGQGSQGDYKGGRIMAKYQSEDKGKTWTFIEQVEPPDQTPG